MGESHIEWAVRGISGEMYTWDGPSAEFHARAEMDYRLDRHMPCDLVKRTVVYGDWDVVSP